MCTIWEHKAGPTEASEEGRTGAQRGFGNLNVGKCQMAEGHYIASCRWKGIIRPSPKGLNTISRQEMGKEEAGVGHTREADSTEL